jgi:hypothetical protein
MTNERLPELGAHAHLLFACLWMVADKDGRLEDRPKKIKAECMPHYEVDVNDLLSRLAHGDDPFILRYTEHGKHYIQVVKWKENQSPHHTEKASVIPAPPLNNGELTNVQPDAHYQQPVTSNQELEGGSGGKPKRFVAPTIAEVQAYCDQLGYTMDAEKFWHHFEARGWRTKEGQLRSWKSAVVNWQKNDKIFGAQNGPQPVRRSHRYKG